jgi:hypothetical protein
MAGGGRSNLNKEEVEGLIAVRLTTLAGMAKGASA